MFGNTVYIQTPLEKLPAGAHSNGFSFHQTLPTLPSHSLVSVKQIDTRRFRHLFRVQTLQDGQEDGQHTLLCLYGEGRGRAERQHAARTLHETDRFAAQKSAPALDQAALLAPQGLVPQNMTSEKDNMHVGVFLW